MSNETRNRRMRHIPHSNHIRENISVATSVVGALATLFIAIAGNSVAQNITSIDNNVTSITDINSTITGIANVIAGVNPEDSDINDRIEELEKQNKDLKDMINNISVGIDTNIDIESIKNDITDNKNKIAEGSIDTKRDIADIKDVIRGITGGITGIQKNIRGITGNITSIQEQIGAITILNQYKQVNPDNTFDEIIKEAESN